MDRKEIHRKWLKRTHEVLNFWNSRNLKSWSHIFKFLKITQLSYKRKLHNWRVSVINVSNTKRHRALAKVPVLHIGDCARSFKKFQPARATKLSAQYVTSKTFFEHLYSVLGLAPIDAPSQLSVYSHTPTAYAPAISWFPQGLPWFFFWVIPKLDSTTKSQPTNQPT